MDRRDKKPQLNPAAGVITGKNACAPGFTLIEVMIALVVLALGLLALAQLQVAAINGLAYSRHYSVATQLAEGQMERLMSYPFSETQVKNINYCPQDKDGHNLEAVLTSGSVKSPFYDLITFSVDTVTGESISYGDAKATRLWLPTAINERGQPAGPSENSYLVTWTVERGGSRGTPGLTGKTYTVKINGVNTTVPSPGVPGPYQIRLVVSVIWFEKGNNKLTAKSPRSSFLDSYGNWIPFSRRATIEGMREISSKEL